MEASRFTRFYTETHRGLYAYIVRSIGNQTASQDILQESYIRFLESDFDDDDDENARKYLYTITSHLVRDDWRRQSRWRRWFQSSEDTPGYVETAGVDSLESSIDHRLDLTKALGQLPPKQRSMVWLAYVVGFSHSEIGQMLKVSERSVRVILHRARTKLLAVMKSMESDG